MCSNNCINNCGCDCSLDFKKRNECVRGPITAIDVACIPVLRPPPPPKPVYAFSTGTVLAVLASLASGLPDTVTQVGFGTSIPGVTVLGNIITLPGLHEAFSVPRVGTIEDISAAFTVTTGVTLAGSAIINARIYRAPEGSNVFTATSATVNLPPLTGVIVAGTTVSASASFAPVPVALGDRLVMVFSVTTTPGTVGTIITGSASAGITLN